MQLLTGDEPSSEAPPCGVFVTGTGTEVGKTVVAAAIAATFAAEGKQVGVFKPAVTGLDEYADGSKTGDMASSSTHLPDHVMLREAAGSRQSDEEIAPYRYGPPMSPHLAAALAGEEIRSDHLVAAARRAAARHDALVCEGVGGLLVPLTPAYLVRDFALDLGLPLVVAAPPGLGTINHSLLTLEAARSAGLAIAAVILTPWPEEASAVEESNRETIASLGRIRVETLPRLDPGDPGSWPALRLPPRSAR